MGLLLLLSSPSLELNNGTVGRFFAGDNWERGEKKKRNKRVYAAALVLFFWFFIFVGKSYLP